MSEAVIIVTTTATDGTVVRWYRDLSAAVNKRPAVSASRDGVKIHEDDLTGVPRDWVDLATSTKAVLTSNPDADLSHMATHRHSVTSNGPLVPVSKGAE